MNEETTDTKKTKDLGKKLAQGRLRKIFRNIGRGIRKGVLWIYKRIILPLYNFFIRKPFSKIKGWPIEARINALGTVLTLLAIGIGVDQFSDSNKIRIAEGRPQLIEKSTLSYLQCENINSLIIADIEIQNIGKREALNIYYEYCVIAFDSTSVEKYELGRWWKVNRSNKLFPGESFPVYFEQNERGNSFKTVDPSDYYLYLRIKFDDLVGTNIESYDEERFYRWIDCPETDECRLVDCYTEDVDSLNHYILNEWKSL